MHRERQERQCHGTKGGGDARVSGTDLVVGGAGGQHQAYRLGDGKESRAPVALGLVREAGKRKREKGGWGEGVCSCALFAG